MTATRTDLWALAERYEVFLVDQFGVLRGGDGPYPGAADALARLKAMRKTVIILSNSGRSGDYNAARLAQLGFARAGYDAFVTSGDVAYALVESGAVPVEKGLGTRCLTISSGGDANLAKRLGMTPTDDPEAADVVVISGSEADRYPLDHYRALLRAPAAKGRLALCTNPDLEMLVPGGLAPAAGAIAALYEEMGGTVVRIGKPYGDIYEHAHRLAGSPEKTSVVAVGDSLHHDIAGAAGFGIDSVLVRTGVLAGLSDTEIASLMAAEGISSTWLIAGFA
jgi:HAD superfamily hydrolase (TIGR01459 family)